MTPARRVEVLGQLRDLLPEALYREVEGALGGPSLSQVEQIANELLPTNAQVFDFLHSLERLMATEAAHG